MSLIFSIVFQSLFHLFLSVFFPSTNFIFCSSFSSSFRCQICLFDIFLVSSGNLISLYLFIYLATLGLSCSMWDLQFQHTESLVVAYGPQFPDQGSNWGSLHLELGLLATGPPGKSLQVVFQKTCIYYFATNSRDRTTGTTLQAPGFWPQTLIPALFSTIFFPKMPPTLQLHRTTQYFPSKIMLQYFCAFVLPITPHHPCLEYLLS